MDQELIPKLFSSQPGKYIIVTQATLSHLAFFQEREKALSGKTGSVNWAAHNCADNDRGPRDWFF